MNETDLKKIMESLTIQEKTLLISLLLLEVEKEIATNLESFHANLKKAEELKQLIFDFRKEK